MRGFEQEVVDQDHKPASNGQEPVRVGVGVEFGAGVGEHTWLGRSRA